MAICEILVMEDFEQGQSVAGRIYLKDGKLTADAEEGNERLLRNILKNLEEEGGDPEKLLKELPQRYSGFAMRARLVGEEESGNDAAEADAPYTLQVKNDRGETSELTKKHLENARQTKRSLQAHNFEVIIKGKSGKIYDSGPGKKKTYTHLGSGVNWDGWYRLHLRREDGKEIWVNKSKFRKLREEGRISNVPPLGSSPDSPFYKGPTKDSESQRKWHGLNVLIETKAGETREGTDADGKPWSIKMTRDYGELPDTNGVDGDPVDVFLGPDAEAKYVYVIHTMAPPDFEEFDEDKCFLDFSSEAAARKAFYDNYTQPEFFGSLERFPVETFIDKVKSTEKKAKPISVVVDEIRWPSWIGVDLDNTLEIPVEGDFNPLIIGPPNPAMVERVKKALQSGQTVKVFTARLAVEEPLRSQIRKVISKWTLQHVGQKLESTNEKDPGLIEIWDDRAKPIV